jgi:hypothetical protein
MKTRIIQHMNADHALSLRLYLQHYLHVPSQATSNAKVLDITTSHMIVQSSYGRHVIPFNPEMKDFREARDRLVKMHEECKDALDLSDIVVDRYALPDRLWQWGVISLCILIFATLPWRENVVKQGTWSHAIWSLGGRAEWLAKLSYTMAPLTLGIIVMAHGAEAGWMMTGRLRRHWVETGSWVWWGWVLDNLVQGSGALMRFDRVVKRAEIERNAKAPQGRH